MRVGLIGLGNMGGRIARRLVGAGHEVLGYDLRAGLAGRSGATPVDGVAAACAADAVLLSLPRSADVEAVVLGQGGVVESARSGLVVADLSTSEPASTRRLYARLEERGVEYLDAGISGGPAAAEAGTLTLMVGGSAAALERVRPVLECFGSRIFHLGAPGNGHAAKAVNNFLNGMNLAAAAEAFVVGARAGLDPALLLEVVNASSGRNWATENRLPRILAGDWMEGTLTHALMVKDLEVYAGLGREAGTATPLGDACRALFAAALEDGYADRPSNAIVDYLGGI